ncbi:MAG: bifunctional lysylphosphatidylglycerol flippase/synthetase MprF [Salinisphaera sp.]|jgi:phosphatidylglycerol lysyltransferase|nr:bifunctional lysylphosphatidylglycerol flippase/synthetase MprF [Salinisphaera sp.]
MATDSPATTPLLVTLRRSAPLLLIVVIAALLLIEARHVDLREIQRTLAAVARWKLAGLGIGGLIAVAAMALYDILAAHTIGIQRRIVDGLRTGVLASGVNNVASLSGITGSGLRVLLLVRTGIDSAQAVRYAGLVALASPLGLSVLAWVVLLTEPRLLHAAPVPIWAIRAALAVLAAYLPGYLLLAMTPLFRRGRLAAVERLTPIQASGFVAASVVEWLLAAGLFWLCLFCVGQTVAPTAVVAAFVLAATLGMLSFLPGGLGVFDVTLGALLVARGTPSSAVVAALVLYRYAYYLVPLIAALFLGSQELTTSRMADTLRRHPVVNLMQWPLARAVDLGIRLLSWLTASAGIVLLAGAAFPNLLSHTRVLRDWLPLTAVEATHMASVVVGLTLVAAARGLSLRLTRALWLAIGLLIAGAAFGLMRGLDYGTSILLLVVAALLWASRTSFDQQGSLGRQLGAWQWTLALIAALVAYLIIGQTFYNGGSFDPFRFAFGAHEPRFLRGALVATISVIVLVIWTWPRWPRPTLQLPDRAALDDLASWLEAHGSNGYSHLMMLGDKALFHTRDNTAMIGYAAIRNRLIALGDPVGTVDARKRAINAFRQFAEAQQCTPVFYQIEPDNLSLYLDNGFSLFKLGEIARVDLVNFSMTGKANDDKRGALNRGKRLGLSYERIEPPFDAALMAELKTVSDDWLGEKPAEKAFSLGRFDVDYLQRAPLAVVRNADGALLAFASILPSYGHRIEYSIDLMRHLADAPSGTMDYLFLRLMQDAQGLGYQWFSLGMAPLAGVGDTPWASTAEQLARLAFEHGNRFYNYKGLKAFKDKWKPVWHSMYLAYPPDTRLSALQLDIAALVAGGYRRIVAS